jgi:hypothetical protein
MQETALQYHSREYQPLTLLDQRAKRKPALDEPDFQQLLAAAYVLQQHNDSLRAKRSRLDTGWILNQVTKTQSLLRAGGLVPEAAAKLIAERLRAMTDAAGVSISLTSDGYLHCVAESGAAARVPGGSLASNSLVATERLRNGKVFHSADAHQDLRLDGAICRELGVRALLAIPIQQSGQIVGLAEVRWNEADAFHECDVRTGQLLAALVTEVLDRGAGSRISPAGKPQPSPEVAPSELAAADSVASPEADDGWAQPADEPVAEATPLNSPAHSSSDPKPPTDALAAQCRVCGRPFRANEAFCGNCSMPRVTGAAWEGLQSKWASLWYMQQAHEVLEEREEETGESQVEAFNIEPQSPDDVAQRDEKGGENKETLPESVWRRAQKAVEPTRPTQESVGTMPWTQDSFAAPSWDDAIRAAWGRAQGKLRLRMRRRDAVTAMVALALLVLVVWAWPTAASPHLTWFESVLVKLGVAQVPHRAPTAPTGNPDVRVWVDMHTALYYCPGSSLYGKTPGGQFEMQHDAQQDRFEPATGAVCE